MKFDKLLKNKYLHYAAVALMVINVLGYVAMGSIECILVLGGAAYLAQHFTKNRTADIFIGLFVANILFGCGRLREGMEHGPKKVADDAQGSANVAKKVALTPCPDGKKKRCADGTCQDECVEQAAHHAQAAADHAKAAATLTDKAKTAK